MSQFDFDKYLEEAKADLGAEARDRIRSALGAAVDAAEIEAKARTSQAAECAAEALRGSVMAISQDMDDHNAKALEKASMARSALLNTLSEAEGTQKNVADRIQAAQNAAISKAAAIGDDLAKRLDAQTARAESLGKELNTLKAQSINLQHARTWALTMLAAAGVIVVLVVLIGWAWSSHIVAQGQDEAASIIASGQVELARQITILEAEADVARVEVDTIYTEAREMADLRAQIVADVNRLGEVQKEFGIEVIRRDDRELEMRMGNAVITQELTGHQRLTVGLGDVRLREQVHGDRILVIVDNGLTLGKTSIGSAAHGQEIWWTRHGE